MAIPLLQAKLYSPLLRPDAQRVPRLRLIERLNRGLRRKLTLISAPAGFGKTTLVAVYQLRVELAAYIATKTGKKENESCKMCR